MTRQTDMSAGWIPIAVFACTLLSATENAWAYKLIPVSGGEKDVRAKAAAIQRDSRSGFLIPIVERVVEKFASSVHEGITARIYGCHGPLEDCGNNPREVPPAVLEGVRWNDNPTFRHGSKSLLCRGAKTYIDFASNIGCWLTLFHDADKKTHRNHGSSDVHFEAKGVGDTPPALIYRVHYGDLQFLHSMASWDGEKARDTRRHVMSWAEFTYKVANKEISSLNKPISDLFPALAPMFSANGFSVRSLLVPTKPKMTDDDVRLMAFGSLLHLVEDSFSQAHVSRHESVSGDVCRDLKDFSAPGKILAFHAYNHQDDALHGERDSFDLAEKQASTKNNAVAAGRKLLEMHKAGKPWNDIAPFVACIFDVDNPDVPGGPGDDFVQRAVEPAIVP